MGGGGVFLNFAHRLVPGQRVWLNDKDSAIACLWTAVTKWPEELLKQASLAWLPSMTRLKELNEETEEPVDPESSDDKVLRQALAKLIVQHFNPNGGTNPGLKTKGSSFSGMCNRVRNTHLMLRRRAVRVTAVDCEEVVHTKGRAITYCDPPYFEKGPQCYRIFFPPEKHTSFASALMGCQSPWVLSYDDCPFIRGLYEVEQRKPVYPNGRGIFEVTKGQTTELLSKRCRSDMNRKVYGELLLTTPETAIIAEKAFTSWVGC